MLRIIVNKIIRNKINFGKYYYIKKATMCDYVIDQTRGKNSDA